MLLDAMYISLLFYLQNYFRIYLLSIFIFPLFYLFIKIFYILITTPHHFVLQLS